MSVQSGRSRLLEDRADMPSFDLGIEIYRDRRKGVLGLSQSAYLEKVLKKYGMHASKPTPAPIVKGNSFGKF